MNSPKKREITHADWFKVYNAERPQVYSVFKAYALQMIAVGVTQLSSKLIFERMRWEALMQGKKLKLSNNYHAYYARLFMQDFPQYEGFFAIRATKSDKMKKRRS